MVYHKHPDAGDGILASWEDSRNPVCFCFFLSNFASEDFLPNLLPPRFPFQVRTTQELMEIRAICHPSVLPPGGRPITLGRETTISGHLPWALASWGLQGLSSWLLPNQHGPVHPAPA